MNRTCISLVTLAVLAAAIPGARVASAQPAPKKLELALYAPSIPFKDTASRLAYLKTLADAIASNTGQAVEPRLYGSLAELRKAKPDLAIIEAQCLAVGKWRPLASATIGGKTTRAWSLYAAKGESLASLRGKKLAFGASGCRDNDFIEGVLFDSEIRIGYFKGTSGKSTVSGAVADVTGVKAAQAVFAPEAQAAGLTRLFEVGELPNPLLVAVSDTVSKKVADEIGRAARRFGSSGAVDGWAEVDDGALSEMRRQMRGRRKTFVFAEAPVVHLPYRDFLASDKGGTVLVPVERYFDTEERRP